VPEQEASSLDRFINTRGAALAGFGDTPERRRRLLLAGGIQAATGLAILVAGLFGGGDMLVGLGMAGAVAMGNGALLATIATLRFRDRGTEEEVALTPEARELLHRLVTHLGGWWAGRRHRRGLRRAARRGYLTASPTGRCADVLSPPAYELLDRTAFQYNRISGALEAARTSGGGPVAQLAPEIRAAANEAMAAALHEAALLDRYPETAESRSGPAGVRVEELDRLAEHVERLGAAGADATLGEAPSRVRTLLDRLQQDEIARAELSGEPRVEQVQQLRR
jgi:hypothetical protein